jgi:hypothetical protein
MFLSFRSAARSVALAAAVVASTGAHAGYVFTNDKGGDGALTGAFPAFAISGPDNGVDAGFADVAAYVRTFAAAASITFDWRYQTFDDGGALFDPGGYVLNGVRTPLSGVSEPGEIESGRTTVAVGAGDTFGWYVESFDSEFGRGELDVSVEAVPEPAPARLMAAAGGLVAAMAWLSRQRKAASRN